MQPYLHVFCRNHPGECRGVGIESTPTIVVDDEKRDLNFVSSWSARAETRFTLFYVYLF